MKNKRYMLISMCEREIDTKIFNSLNMAQNAMRTEMLETGGVEEKDLYWVDGKFNRIPIDNPSGDDFEVKEKSAYINTKYNFDWYIVPLDDDKSYEEEVAELSDSALWKAYDKCEHILVGQLIREYLRELKKSKDITDNVVLNDKDVKEITDILLYETDGFGSYDEGEIRSAILNWNCEKQS